MRKATVFSFLVLLVSDALAVGWGNVQTERREFPVAKSLWRSSLTGVISYELRAGAEGSVVVSGAVVGSTVELLFVNILPISGNNLKRNILWRNRLIAALVNAVLAAVLGRFMLGAGNLFVLFLIAVAACVIAVLVAGVISDIRYRHSIEEMNRRLKQLNSITGGHTGTDGE